MKKLSFTNVRVIISIVLCLIAFAVVMPLHNKIRKSADAFTNDVLEKIQKVTKFRITYESLSPSILSTINIKNVSAIKESDEEQLVHINKIKISYKLLKLFKLDISGGISSVIIDGIEVDLDGLISFIQSFNFNFDQEINIDIETIKGFIPSNVYLKNISVLYNNQKIDTGITVKDIAVLNSEKDSISFNLKSRAFANITQVNQNINASIDINGTIYSNLDNSNLTIKFTDITNGNLTLNKLCLFAEYNNKVFNINTIQTINPIYVAANFNLDSMSGNATVKTEKVNVLSLISVNSNPKELKKFKNFMVDTDTSVSFNVSDVKNPLFKFFSKGNVFVPDEILKGSAVVDYQVDGNQEIIHLTKLNIDGKNCAANIELDFDISKFQLSGIAELPYFIMPNGKSVSTELYFDPLEKGFMIFSPQIFIGQKVLTALQASVVPQQDSYDFVLDVYDYSHSADGEPGNVSLNGSYLSSSNYIQTNIALNGLYLDSLFEFAMEVMNEEDSEKIENLHKTLSPFIFSADSYISTDFKSVSYSFPYILAVNTKQDNQVLMLVANGNEQSIQLNQLSLVAGNFAMSAAASVDIEPETSELFYTLDLNLASIPYHFSGTVMKNFVSLSGDYGTEAQVSFNNNTVNGYAVVENLPFSVGSESFVFTLNSGFSYDSENGPQVSLQRISLENVSSVYTVDTKIIASGNITKYGAQLDSITYTDFFSSLEGSADVMLNITDNIFNSVGIIANLRNPHSDESISLDAMVSNPELVVLDSSNFKSALYLNTQLQINNFSLNRFAKLSHENNILTASLFATGTIEHPYVALTIDKASMLISAAFWELSGIAVLEDKNVSIQDFKISCPGMLFNDINAEASLETFTGTARAKLELGIPGSDIIVPMNLVIEDTIRNSDSFIPSSFNGKLSVSDLGGALIKKQLDASVSFIYLNNTLSLFSSENLGAYGTLSTNGKMEFTVDNLAAKLKIYGDMAGKDAEIKFYDMNVNLPQVCSYFAIDDFLIVKQGNVRGNFSMMGELDDPDFKGALLIENPRVAFPTLFKNDITTEKILITAMNNIIQIRDTVFALNGVNRIMAGCSVCFNKWSLDHINVSLKSYQKEYIPFNVDLGFLKFIGDVVGDLNLLLQSDGNYIDMTGKVFAENVNISSNLTDLAQGLSATSENPNQSAILAKFDISLGTHVSVDFDPILRCVFAPNTKFVFSMNSYSGSYVIDGALNLKSGDIAYLNRNFYIKSGSIKFNPSDIANPLVTLRAETRERDENGNNVKIILSAENQYLMNLAPHFSSEPPKSELEIQMLLGQIITGDSNTASSFIAAASDYALQSMLFRRTENKLRELLNFDIFSLRTNVLQNSVNMYSNEMSVRDFGLGNLLDNSTVYIGKYLGSSLYVDAMLQLSFENGVTDFMTPGALIFKPDFGMELESPFGNIRWNMSPNINALMHNQYVPSTSVSLSWKFSF